MDDWRPIPDLRGYEVTPDGRVRSVRRSRPVELVQAVDAVGYRTVGIRDAQGRPRWRRVHVLVALAFHGPRPPGAYVCHNDGNQMNNHVENLRYDTPSGNQQDAILHGTSRTGSRNFFARLTEADVPRIRAMRAEGASLRTIAQAFGVSRMTISRIASGRTWRHA